MRSEPLRVLRSSVSGPPVLRHTRSPAILKIGLNFGGKKSLRIADFHEWILFVAPMLTPKVLMLESILTLLLPMDRTDFLIVSKYETSTMNSPARTNPPSSDHK